MATETKVTDFPSMRRSLLAAAVLLIVDAAMVGSFLYSALICPIWLLGSAVKSAISRPGWNISFARMAVPVGTLALVALNSSIQTTIAESNAAKVTAALERYHQARGNYPGRLSDLVPAFIGTVPPAKYSLSMGDFLYRNMGKGESCMLMWTEVPPFSRRVYDCKSKTWGSLD